MTRRELAAFIARMEAKPHRNKLEDKALNMARARLAEYEPSYLDSPDACDWASEMTEDGNLY